MSHDVYRKRLSTSTIIEEEDIYTDLVDDNEVCENDIIGSDESIDNDVTNDETITSNNFNSFSSHSVYCTIIGSHDASNNKDKDSAEEESDFNDKEQLSSD